ncbi:MAG: hypothetical protein PVH61_21365 [Candidatus Aminicenantes bacterium]|jgi:hypothetical protein
MVLSKWRKKHKFKTLSRLFGDLLESGDIQSALTLYKVNLLPLPYEVNKSIRTAYHLYNWLTFNKEEDFRAIQLLAVNEPAESKIIRSLTLIRCLKKQKILARALVQQDTEMLKILKENNGTVEREPMNNLGICILEMLAIKRKVQDESEYHKIPANIIKYLPAADRINKKFLNIRDRLYVWAMYMNRDYKHLLETMDNLRAIPSENLITYKIETIYKWCQEELYNGHIDEALQILKGIEPYVEFQQLFKIILLFGFTVLNRNMATSAVRWFSTYTENPDIRKNRVIYNTLLLCLGVSYFKDNKLEQGRKVLEPLHEDLDRSPEGISKENLLSQVWYLQSVSLLTETGSWSGPIEEHPAMWRRLRERTLQYTKKLTTLSSSQAWKGYFLEGLMAYVESSSALNMEQLNIFTSAIENISGKEMRIRLKAIEAVLLTRIKATEEAADLIKKRKYKELRKFQQNVLEPLGDAVPAFVRAAVYISIWEGDPSYDPIPSLKQIPRSPDNEALLNKCISYIQAIQTIRQLKDICTRLEPSAMNLPQLTSLNVNPEVAKIGNLAAAVVHLYSEKWDEVLSNSYLDNQDENQWFQKFSSYVIFYAAWRAGNVSFCQQIINDKKRNTMLKKTKYLQKALIVRSLLNDLENGPGNSPENFISVHQRKREWINLLISLTIWLIQHKKSEAAATFLELVKAENPDNSNTTTQREGSGMDWLCSFLEGLIMADTGKYNACIERFELTISKTTPPGSIFKDPQAIEQLKGWAKLFILQAKLVLTVQSTDQMKVRWPSLRRELETRARELQGNQFLEAYKYLIMGLVSFLSTDMLIDESIIVNLAFARKVLSLNEKAHFIEEILGKLNWRKNVLEHFWIGLSTAKFQESQAVYQNELKPAFENRVPHSIQLAMVLVDWDLNNQKTTELLNRLSLLEHHAPELSNKFITKVKNYILECDKLRHLKKLTEEQEFNNLIDFARSTEWEGFGKDAMPVPVVIALLYALYKSKKEVEAQHLGEIISGDDRLPDWVKDYGMLLMGYIFFEKREFQKASEFFGNISRSRILSHDVDKYWAAAHFSSGLQLLAVDQKEQAFDAFARAINKRGAVLENIKLIPLFFHLALKHIETGNGKRALMAFQLLKKSLEGPELEKAEDVFIPVYIANTGELLCKSLIENNEIPREKDFDALRKQLINSPGSVPGEVKHELDRTCRIMTICHVLKKQLQPWSKLKKFLEEHLDTLEIRTEVPRKNDYVVFVLRSLIELKFNNNVSEALKWFENAKQLGCNSKRLDKLFTDALSN